MGCYYITMSLPEPQGRRHDLLVARRSANWPIRWARSTRTRGSRCGCPRIAASAKTTRRRQATATIIDTTVGRVMFNDDPAEGHAVLQHADAVAASWPSVISRLLPDPRPPRDDRPARRHEPARLPRSTRSGLSFATDDLITPRQQGADHRRRRKESAQDSTSSINAASSPRASVTTRCSTPGRTPASRSRPK